VNLWPSTSRRNLPQPLPTPLPPPPPPPRPRPRLPPNLLLWSPCLWCSSARTHPARGWGTPLRSPSAQAGRCTGASAARARSVKPSSKQTKAWPSKRRRGNEGEGRRAAKRRRSDGGRKQRREVAKKKCRANASRRRVWKCRPRKERPPPPPQPPPPPPPRPMKKSRHRRRRRRHHPRLLCARCAGVSMMLFTALGASARAPANPNTPTAAERTAAAAAAATTAATPTEARRKGCQKAQKRRKGWHLQRQHRHRDSCRRLKRRPRRRRVHLLLRQALSRWCGRNSRFTLRGGRPGSGLRGRSTSTSSQ